MNDVSRSSFKLEAAKSDAALSASDAALSAFSGLAPLVLIVFFGFLAVGVPLPTLSLQIHNIWGFDTFTAGWVIGIQSLATIVTRHRAGTLSDHRGAHRAVRLGLPLATVAAFVYLAAIWAPLPLAGRLTVLVVGRLTLGFAESLFITGAMSWGIARLGPKRTGLVMSWQGIAMYAALGFGAPLGLMAQKWFGFTGVALVACICPLIALAIAYSISGAAGSVTERVPFYRVIGLIWRPGSVVALATAPFAAMAAFLASDYAAHGWANAGLALAAFGTTYIVVRLIASHLPDRFGSMPVAAVSLVIETIGQIILWRAGDPLHALAGAAITGVGFSLIFPSMGIEATRQTPPDQRGRAVGNFIAFFDLSIGMTGPIVGLIVSRSNYSTAFLAGAISSCLALVALWSAHYKKKSVERIIAS